MLFVESGIIYCLFWVGDILLTVSLDYTYLTLRNQVFLVAGVVVNDVCFGNQCPIILLPSHRVPTPAVFSYAVNYILQSCLVDIIVSRTS